MVRPYAFDHFPCICQAVIINIPIRNCNTKKLHEAALSIAFILALSFSSSLSSCTQNSSFFLLGKSFRIVNICYQATTYSMNSVASNRISVDSYGQIVKKKRSNRVYNPCSMANRHMIWMWTMYIPYGIFLKIIDSINSLHYRSISFNSIFFYFA